eukprot:2878539-Pyramimonas_sp.AAC.1
MSDEMDALENNYSELVSQISSEVQPRAPKKDPVPKGPSISLRAAAEAEEVNFILEDDLLEDLPKEYEMSPQDKEQLETRKKLLQNGLKDMAKN